MFRVRLAGALLFIGMHAAAAQGMSSQMSHGSMGAGANGGDMGQAMQRMNRDMEAAPMTGDADRDFVAMMIPHHQGAIDMARIYLRDGKDPAMRRLARSIVADQQREIAQMTRWRADHH